MRKYKLQKAGRRISLFRTAGTNKQMKNSYWSPRPEARQHLHLYAERRTPSPYKKQQPAQVHQSNHTAQTLLQKRDREKNTLMALQQTVPLQTHIMKNQTWQMDFTALPCPLNLHQNMKKDKKVLTTSLSHPSTPHQMFVQMFQLKTPSMT